MKGSISLHIHMIDTYKRYKSLKLISYFFVFSILQVEGHFIVKLSRNRKIQPQVSYASSLRFNKGALSHSLVIFQMDCYNNSIFALIIFEMTCSTSKVVGEIFKVIREDILKTSTVALWLYTGYR